MATKPPDPFHRFTVRLPPALMAHIERAAEARGVSANAEMVDRLEQGRMADLLFRGVVNVRDLGWLVDWVEMVKEGCRRVYVDAELWPRYAHVAPFVIERNKAAAEAIYSAVAKQVAKDVDAALDRVGPKSARAARGKARGAQAIQGAEAIALLTMISRNREAAGR